MLNGESIWEQILPGIIGLIGVIIGAIISYFLNDKNTRKNIIYNIILEQYMAFIKLKEKFDCIAVDVEIYQLQDIFTHNINDKNLIIKEMDKILNVLNKSHNYISIIKKHMLNNQYIFENNNIMIEPIIMLHGYKYKNIILKEINNYKYIDSNFNIERLIENQKSYTNFINEFSKLLINIKVEMEKVLFKEKICYSFANKIKNYLK